MLNMNTYDVAEFARLTGVSVKTLQRWDRQGKLRPLRTPTNRRLYTDEHLQQATGRKVAAPKRTVVYARVSSQGQKADLQNQRAMLEQFCAARGFAVDEWITEIGGGLNFKRPKFLALVDEIVSGQVGRLVIAHKDRLTRFGFDLVAHLCERAGCELVVLNTESLSPEQEMVQDLMTVVHCFSSRLYGLRNYRKALVKAIENDTRPQDTTEPDA